MKAAVLIVALLAASNAYSGALDETRYCREPPRDSAGVIVRSAAVRAAFQRLHPCPSTRLPTGRCPGWQKDHIIPMGAKHPVLGGGCDSVANMQWLPVEIKTCSGLFCKDRWELLVYSLTGG